MNYIEVDCRITPCHTEIAEILTAELSESGFESFVETDYGILAYIPEDDYRPQSLSSLTIVSSPDFDISFTSKTIKQENWNETWEKNYFEPILIEDKCVIRSSFHKEFPEIEYQITIDPKMAFGTGHHETTSLMIKEILQLGLENKSVLDMGCGTGVLAILSAMKGAKDITAIDIDEWSYNNTLENMKLNGISAIRVVQGDVAAIPDKQFDVIYANINKNVLLKDIPIYANHLEKGALMLLSGFYTTDFADIDAIATNAGLELAKKEEKNTWIMLNYIKR